MNLGVAGLSGHAHVGKYVAVNPVSCQYPMSSNVTGNLSGTWDGKSSEIMSWTNGALSETGTFTANPPPATPLAIAPPPQCSRFAPVTSLGRQQLRLRFNFRPDHRTPARSQHFHLRARAIQHRRRNCFSQACWWSPPTEAVEDDAIACVLAQLQPNGRLSAVTESTMKAALTEALTGASQTGTVLDHATKSNVAGATFYFGLPWNRTCAPYAGRWSLSGSHKHSGRHSVHCQPGFRPGGEGSRGAHGALVNASESGWGIHFTERESTVFAAWYTYDLAGNPKWYVAS